MTPAELTFADAATKSWLDVANEAIELANEARIAGDVTTALAASVYAAQCLQIHRNLGGDHPSWSDQPHE